MTTPVLPIPPLEIRRLVGPTDPAAFDNPDGRLVFPDLSPQMYEAVFDFGCGCGRLARQLIQQHPRPFLYVGVDLHPGMIQWCNENLAPHAAHFHFFHHDVQNAVFNPGPDKAKMLPFPVSAGDFSLVVAWSVFTHLTQAQAEHYLREVRRILRPDGLFMSTWFLFDKREFPMLSETDNALYTSDLDPSAAVIFDREWLRRTISAAGLTIISARAPLVRGHQWVLHMEPTRIDVAEVEIPPDIAPLSRPRVEGVNVS